MEKDIIQINKDIPSLHILKLLCAIMVIAIHIPIPAKNFFMPFLRISVPIFYMISGFFLCNNRGEISKTRILKILKNVIIITILLNLLYLSEKSLMHTLNNVSVLELLIEGSGILDPLWYLNAYIYALIIIYFFVKFKWEKLFPIIILTGILLNFTFGSYSFLIFEKPIHIFSRYFLYRNFITTALPCILIGLMLRRKKIYPKLNYLIWILISLAIFALIEQKILNIYSFGGDVNLLTLPMAIILFFICLLIPFNNNNLFVYAGKHHSANLYFFHILAFAILSNTFLYPLLRENPIYIFPSVVITTFVISLFFNAIRSKLMNCTKSK